MSDPRPPHVAAPDLAAARARLAAARGPRYWRCLEELVDDPRFEELLRAELPADAERWPADLDRRRFLQLAAASLALAGVGGCTRQPPEHIVPHVRAPEQRVPGRPQWFATAHLLDGWARGVLVESHEGRPTKLEGNPDHPWSLGATDLFAQASVLGVYDPDRSQAPTEHGRVITARAARERLAAALEPLRAQGGKGLALLTGRVTSPTDAALLARLQRELPSARWCAWEPADGGAARGARAAFGRAVGVHHELAEADVILALDADLLVSGPGAVRAARQVMERRDPAAPARWNRLYALETAPSGTGTRADHRLPVDPAGLAAFTLALAAELGVPGVAAPSAVPHAAWVAPLARDLAARRRRCAVVCGEHAPPALHVLTHAINARLGALGSCVRVTEPVEAQPRDGDHDLAAFTAALREGEAQALLVLDANPVYAAPAALGFAEAMERVAFRAQLGTHVDETAARCPLHLPRVHDLERWGDARAVDGTATLLQPLMAPLHEGLAPTELLALLLGREADARSLVREHWRAAVDSEESEAAFEARWRRWLRDGVVPDSAAPPLDPAPSPAPDAVARAADEARALAASPPADALQLALRPDPTVRAGAEAGNGWLQECPKPITALTWGNALLLAPADAERLGVAHRERVRVRGEHGALELPAWITPGHASGAATLHLGGGRTRAGRVGDGVGVNAAALRPASGALTLPARVTGTGTLDDPPCTRAHHTLDEITTAAREAERRELVRHGTLAQFASDPEALRHGDGHAEPPSLHADRTGPGPGWGMSIDLGRCTACNACVVACQAENNVPVVGAEQVRRGREMHWLRIDTYHAGPLDAPDFHNQPVPCMHCEQAPCEVVCPVSATVHSDDGLNDMVYNRCVGTRYCSNNCPYKVRRFNFLDYRAHAAAVEALQHNPDVTVRSRGVMEKCTYCVQRIRAAGIAAGREGRAIADGEVLPACAQACATQAIVFGDVLDPDTRVSAAKRSPLDYGLLAELGTRPRTTYLASLRHPNPELERQG